MRLSILIPSYNYDCRPLVDSLLSEMKFLDAGIELIVANDASDFSYLAIYDSIRSNLSVQFMDFQQNQGRSVIRNKLAQRAIGEYLLFLDNDVMPLYPDFLGRYLIHLSKSDASVVCGGRVYSAVTPVNSELKLHWVYGTIRECPSAQKRGLTPWKAFQSNNFLIKKEAFLSLLFDERVQGYGHEDTLFGIFAEKAGLAINHIDNPAIHMGLEPADVFLNKVDQSVQNAVKIYRQFGIVCNRATSLALCLDKLKMRPLLIYFFEDSRMKTLRSSLAKGKISLFKLDLYKLILTLKLL